MRPALPGLQQETADKAKDEARLHLNRGAGYLQRNEKERAIRELKSALALDSQSAAAHMLLGQAYWDQGSVQMIAEAKAELQQALDLDPNLIWARFYLAKIYLDLGRTEKAERELQRALQVRSNVPHFLSLLGEANRRLGHLDVSVQLNKKALEIDPSMNAAHYYLALAYLDLKNEEEAIRELESALQSNYVIPEMYEALGSIYTRRGRLEAAGELLRKAIALDPSRLEGRLKLAEIYRLQGAYHRALEELKAAGREERRLLNTEYFQQLRADISFERGRVYQDRGMSSQAVEAYSQALQVDPSHGKSHRQLAEVLCRQGDFARALEHASRAEKLGFPIEPSLREEILRHAQNPKNAEERR